MLGFKSYLKEEKEIEIKVKAVDDCSEEEITDFAELVAKGGEVTLDSLIDRITSRGILLVFAYDKNKLVGVAGLKNPYESYRNSIVDKADFKLPKSKYPYEMGWIYINPSYRGKKISFKMIEAAKKGNAGIFATIRTSNIAMQKIITKAGYKKVGKPYPSSLSSDTIDLYINGVN